MTGPSVLPGYSVRLRRQLQTVLLPEARTIHAGTLAQMPALDLWRTTHPDMVFHRESRPGASTGLDQHTGNLFTSRAAAIEGGSGHRLQWEARRDWFIYRVVTCISWYTGHTPDMMVGFTPKVSISNRASGTSNTALFDRLGRRCRA